MQFLVKFPPSRYPEGTKIPGDYKDGEEPFWRILSYSQIEHLRCSERLCGPIWKWAHAVPDPRIRGARALFNYWLMTNPRMIGAPLAPPKRLLRQRWLAEEDRAWLVTFLRKYGNLSPLSVDP